MIQHFRTEEKVPPLPPPPPPQLRQMFVLMEQKLKPDLKALTWRSKKSKKKKKEIKENESYAISKNLTLI